MKQINRRDFLRAATVAVAGAAAAACAPTAAPAPATNAPQNAAPQGAAPAQPAAASTAVPAAAAPKPGGTLNYAEAGDFTAFNPWRMEAANTNMHNQVFDRLIWKDATGKEQLQLAEAWEMAKDGLSATIKVRQDAKWHDGKSITAQDFVTMYGYTKDENLLKDGGYRKTRDLLVPVKDIKATDQYTLQFAFASPLPYFTDILDYLWAIRVDDPNDPAFIKKPPVGSGPFKLAEWVPNQYAKLVRFDGYYMKGKPYLDTFMFKRLDKPETLVPNIQSGSVDGIYVSAYSDVQQLSADKNLTVVTTQNPGSHYPVMINVNKPPFDKREVRQALSYALNREEIAKNAFFGVSKPISSMFFDPNSLGYRQDLDTYYKFDLDKAGQLLSQAGVKNLEYEIYVTPRWPSMKLFCLIWQADLTKIGVKMTVTEVEQAKFMEVGGDKNMKGMAMIPWVVGRATRDPAIFFGTQVTHRGGATAKHGWQNEELEKLIAQGAVELDPAKRKQIYQRCNEIIVTEAPMISVATDPRIWAWNNKVKGVVTDLVGDITLTDVTLA